MQAMLRFLRSQIRANLDNTCKSIDSLTKQGILHMNKSLLLASLVAAVALSACGKKEEAPAPAPAPAAAPAPAPAPAPAAAASDAAAPAAAASAAAPAASK